MCWSTKAGSPAWRERLRRSVGSGGTPSLGAPPLTATGSEAGSGSGRRGDLDDVGVGVAEVDRPQPTAVEHVGALDPVGAQVFAPRVQLRARGNGEGQVVRRAGAPDPRRQRGVL